MKNLSRTVLGGMASALLLSGFVLYNVGAQADVPYSKIGRWSVAYLEVGNLSGCRAAAQFPDQTIFQMALMQSGTNKSWVIFISNPKWGNWRQDNLPGEFAGQELLLVTTKPWRLIFSSSDDGKTLFTDTSVKFMNSVADAASVEIMYINRELLTAVDMKDSAAAIRAVMKCVREPPSVPSPEPEKTTLSGTGFFVAPNLLITNNHVVRGCTKPIQVRYPQEVGIPQRAPAKMIKMIWFCCIPRCPTFRLHPSDFSRCLAKQLPLMDFLIPTFCLPEAILHWEILPH